MPGNMNTVRKLSWYDLIHKGLADSGLAAAGRSRPTAGVVKRYSRPERYRPRLPAAALEPRDAHRSVALLAADAGAPEAPPEACCARPIPAIDDGHRGREPANRPAARKSAAARHAGAPAAAIAARYRARTPARGRAALSCAQCRRMDRGEREALADGVLALDRGPAICPRFAPGSRAEVSIVGRLDRPGRPPALVSGQIDRLVVRRAEVLIVDYKTNHAPPETAGRGAGRLYPPARALPGGAGELYPQSAVRAALLWTETPELWRFPPPRWTRHWHPIISA